MSAILSDIVVDDGRLMRLRFCGSDGDNEREEEVCTSLSVEEALAKLQAAHAEDSPGDHRSAAFRVSLDM